MTTTMGQLDAMHEVYKRYFKQDISKQILSEMLYVAEQAAWFVPDENFKPYNYEDYLVIADCFCKTTNAVFKGT